MRMKKNVTIILLIAVFIGWFAFRFFNRPGFNPAGENKPSLALDWDQLPKETNKESPEPKSLKNETTPPVRLPSEPKSKTYEEMAPDQEEKFEIFDKMEKKWLDQVKTIIGPKNYPIYLDMRDQNEKEKAEAYKQYHEYLRQKHGDQFSYKISEDQSTAEKNINQKYLKELVTIIGEQKFAEYLKARDQINEEYRRQNKLFIQIEF
jgi:hypothetical protein